MSNLFLLCQKQIQRDPIFALYGFVNYFCGKTLSLYNSVSKSSTYCLGLSLHYLLIEGQQNAKKLVDSCPISIPRWTRQANISDFRWASKNSH